MIPEKQKTKRIGKHDFRITGRPKVHFSGKCIVSFAPLPPKYCLAHLAKRRLIQKSCLRSTMTASTILIPLSYPQILL